jgi:hypothetical protein
VRFAGRWKLTDSDPYDNGMILALMAWAQKREFYALLGLKGPPMAENPHAYTVRSKTNESEYVALFHRIGKEVRNCPSYPEPHWFRSLSAADYKFAHLGPLKEISALGTGHLRLPASTSGQPEPRQHYADNISRSVNGACSRWLSERHFYG